VTRRLTTFVLAMIALLSITSIVSMAQSQTLVTRHTREEVTGKVAPLVGHVSGTKNMDIVLVLQHRNQPELDQLLKDLYDRSSSSYRHFLTVEQFTERFGPSSEDYEAAKNWARQNGLRITGDARNRMILPLNGSVQNIERALHVTINRYQHPTENRIFYAPDREPAPDMSIRLWSVGGLDNFSRPTPLFVRRNASAQPDDVIADATTGSCPQASFCGSDMRSAYYGGSLTGSGQSVGIFEFLGTNLSDLTTYYTNAHQTNNVPITLLSVDGQKTDCTDNSAGGFCDDTEQTLDMTQALGMAPNMSSLVMYIGKGGLAGQSLDDPGIFNAMATANPLNHQLSSSWSWRPADPTVDEPFFQEFAAQGQNLFQASGDSGKWVAGNFVWPADDGLLTSVGGTVLTTNGAGGSWKSETAWSDGGGGISTDNISIPTYQVSTAAGCSKCSKTLRNGPDVSANSDFSFYVCSDQSGCTANNFGGTSFAAPMWAGFLALVNQQAVSNGQSVLGFVNPAIYDIGLGNTFTQDFHDVTTGSNGFSATPGFDLATGWGSPNGQALIDELAGGGGASGFSLSASPTSVTVAKGATGTSKITSTTTGGFNTPVKLTATGQPAGVTVSFSPTSITGTGNSTLTLKVAASTVAGTYPITVKGTAGSTTETTTVSLVVSGGTTKTFTLTAAPNKVTVKQGATGTSKVTTTVSGGFNAAVALTASGQGAGVTVTFNPKTIAAPGAGTSTVSIKVAATATTGNRTITVKGTGGGVTKTATITLTIAKK
jgi:subtilase family serine protease